MPYIIPSQREKYTDALKTLKELMLDYGTSSGELNYLIYSLCLIYMKEKGTTYKHLEDVVGTLENVKAEFIRRVVFPYEDQKIELNGDIRI